MRVLLVANTAASMVWFRLPLLRMLRERGHHVWVLAPDGRGVDTIVEAGASFLPLPQTQGWSLGAADGQKGSYANPLVDGGAVRAIRRACRVVRPDVVLAYTHKMTVLTAWAARAAGVPHVHGMVTGMGFANLGGGLRRAVLRQAYHAALRAAAPALDSLVVLNRDNLSEAERLHLAPGSRLWLMDGEGLDTSAWDSAPPEPKPGAPTFLMIARLVWHKGVRAFVEAAHRVHRDHPGARFVLAGGVDPTHPDAIPRDLLDAWRTEGVVEQVGFVDDIRALHATADVFVLPSDATEGLPMSIMEAMAMRRPILTTANPGNRETVDEGVNGFLVPFDDVDALARKMAWCCEHTSQLAAMGEASREKVVRRFDAQVVNAALLDHLGL